MTTNERIKKYVSETRNLSDEKLEVVADEVIKLLEAIDGPETQQEAE